MYLWKCQPCLPKLAELIDPTRSAFLQGASKPETVQSQSAALTGVFDHRWTSSSTIFIEPHRPPSERPLGWTHPASRGCPTWQRLGGGQLACCDAREPRRQYHSSSIVRREAVRVPGIGASTCVRGVCFIPTQTAAPRRTRPPGTATPPCSSTTPRCPSFQIPLSPCSHNFPDLASLLLVCPLIVPKASSFPKSECCPPCRELAAVPRLLLPLT